MSLFAPPNTLAYQLRARPLSLHRDMSHVPVQDVAVAMMRFMAGDPHPSTPPEAEALEFYALNHLVALVRRDYDWFETLPPPLLALVERYNDACAPKACRAFYYLLLICLRESRHLGNKAVMLPALAAEFGEGVPKIITCLSDQSTGAAATMKGLADQAGLTMGPFCRALSRQFHVGQYSTGYGGPAWGRVSDCLLAFVSGEYSAEMLLDTVWTLCHNNGPIFNKGMLYSSHGPALKRILDVQRSGQVPEAILHEPGIRAFAPKGLPAMLEAAAGLFPGSIGAYVDWFKVEALGSLHAYPTEKKAQVAQHGFPEGSGPADLATPAPKKAKPSKLPAETGPMFQIMPGLALPKVMIDRTAAAARAA
ncbi:hypothetical protein [Niveispirillum sp. BGYR6]|uniref:hypothetical protein n=1 Tax=Niveispirillum sp. BGYR6 TaxID=2971249 RepID=UPI0022B94F05|nr:hypothetical protein [Niveispirillum sp. BGYR6]MDG5496956.1 hypothetical protein [Niveispirillum sp. BGYR6]